MKFLYPGRRHTTSIHNTSFQFASAFPISGKHIGSCFFFLIRYPMEHIKLIADRDAPSFSSPSQGNKNNYVYEVFINHRNTDVKKTLTNHISYVSTLFNPSSKPYPFLALLCLVHLKIFVSAHLDHFDLKLLVGQLKVPVTLLLACKAQTLLRTQKPI
jgi:hypothetical protein